MFSWLTKKLVIITLLLVGCAGVSRNCTGWSNSAFGADWVVVQLSALDGKPIRCWQLENTSMVNEQNSDGIYWKDSSTGNMVHISGFYNRVQVLNKQWDKAFEQIGISSAKRCNELK